MEDCGVVSVVDVSEDTEELAIDVLHGCGEGLREVLACEGITVCEREQRVAYGDRELLTRLGGEGVLIVNHVLYPCHHVIDVGGGGELDALTILVNPSVVQSVQGVRQSGEVGGLSVGASTCRTKATYEGPADMAGHDCCVQHSEMTP